ncbi:hypothetical protein GQX73_g2627 [Xylaria multiplex]|uniref:Quinate/shikimate 5-dehydrogenase/glutamyl-tRNA reductase domain-containing protein n=1 Tax=Xylaria multiplex TaxID=323545 RepID=A0A7C8IWQ3_9PEZI|nr:hypothetical protein GQX73_g2627 [Xylaria multiplex]
MTPELWNAKKIIDSTLHPDTGERVFLPWRMSCAALVNFAISAGMLQPGLKTPGSVFWQVLNQSVNVAVNYSNANKSSQLSWSKVAQSYLLAVGASCSVVIGLNSTVSRLKSVPASTKLILGRLVPFAAVVSASALNVYLTRGDELRTGIDVFPISPKRDQLGLEESSPSSLGKKHGLAEEEAALNLARQLGTDFGAVTLPGGNSENKVAQYERRQSRGDCQRLPDSPVSDLVQFLFIAFQNSGGLSTKTMMGNLLVLGDSIVHDILINLSRAEILAFRDVLAGCLRDFSVGSEKSYQPPVGVVNRPEGQKCLFRPFTSSGAIGVKIVVDPAPSSTAAGALHGIITLCDSDGLPLGIINAEEVTGYRTALSALIPYLWRRYTDNIVVFGAGKQALWHLRLALALRGDEIKSIVIINRTAVRAEILINKIKEENYLRWKSTATIEHLNSSVLNFQELLKSHLSSADAIFCTVGTIEPLFPASHILAEAKERQPYISAVGSWQPDMIELDPELLRHAAKGESGLTELTSGSVLVDDCEGALLHSGEVIRSGLGIKDLVEVGEIESIRQKKGGQWLPQIRLEEGLLMYKSVGVVKNNT